MLALCSEMAFKPLASVASSKSRACFKRFHECCLSINLEDAMLDQTVGVTFVLEVESYTHISFQR